MSEFDFQEKFPNLTPINNSPALFTLNGFGMGVYGRRDYDEETGTYVKTHCLCALFIPIIALRAYRVADAGSGGWYFIGREPLSMFAKLWNLALVVTVATTIAATMWNAHGNSPEYVAGRQLAEADQQAAQGDLVAAAKQYHQISNGPTSHAATARERLRALLDERLDAAPEQETREVLEIIVEAQQEFGLFPGSGQLIERGLALAAKRSSSKPTSALAILDTVAPLDPESETIAGKRRELLEAIVAKGQDSPEIASQLALLYEADGDLEKCEALLKPHFDELGDTEGARILGQRLAQQGDVERSYALLQPYCRRRLERLHTAEQNYHDTLMSTHQQIVGRLERGEGPEWFYQDYNLATPDRQEEIVSEYIASQIKSDPSCAAAERELIAAAEIVPVALDLGVVMLRRGQEAQDPARRQEELARAEKTFLALRGVAGESDEYRLYLGQVYYWLGKHAEGRQLFDELLASSGRSFETLMGVSNLLRQVGAVSESRNLAEEAYQAADTDENRHAAAMQRALLNLDTEDEIAWLRKADTTAPHVKASLAYALGIQALNRGDDDEALAQLQKAVNTYAELPENPSILNNGALANFSLFRLTDQQEHLDQGLKMIEKAVALQPADSLVLGNAGHAVTSVAVRDAVRDRLDLQTLNRYIDLDVLPFLYGDASEREKYAERLREDRVLAKGIDYFERQLVLAPRSPYAYQRLLDLRTSLRDLEGLKQLRDRIVEADLDLADQDQSRADFQAGRDDARIVEQLDTSIKRLQQAMTQAEENGRHETLAVAASLLSRQKLVLTTIGKPADGDEIVRLAEKAHAASPSSGSRTALVNALLQRASQRIAKSLPEFAEFTDQRRRLVSNSSLVTIALSGEGAMRDAALADPDVQRAGKLLKESVEAFPEDASVWHWAVLSQLEPEAAATLVDALATDEQGRLTREIESYLSPDSPSTVLDQYWEAQMKGDDQQAQAAAGRLAELEILPTKN